MTTSENPFAHEAPAAEKRSDSNGTSAQAAIITLRWWPAAVCLILIGALKLSMVVVEAPPMALLMAAFMGPAGLCGVIMLWWTFASRAGTREKVIGLTGVIAIGVLTTLLLHFSMKGMSTVLYQIPCGVSAFALVLILMANRPASRLRAALFLSAVGFGMWDLVQLHGVTGKFDAEFSWRWAPTPEEEYLRGLVKRSESATGSSQSSAAGDTNEQITRATSEWSDFRGPMRDGKRPGLRLKEDWATSPPKEIWKTPIGPGWSSFTVAGQRLFTQEQRGDNEAVVCLSAETGKVLWAHEYGSRFWEAIAGAGPRATPTIGDEGIYSLGANGHVLCLDPITGEVRWTKDLQVDTSCKPPQWGFSASPLVQDGLVIFHAGAATGDGAVLAYDAKSGDVRWKVSSGNHSYCSAHPAVFDHVSGLLMSTNLGLQFLSVADGSTIWNHEWTVENYRAIQPLVIGDSVLIGTSLGVGTRRINVTHQGDLWKISEAWTAKDMKPDFNDFVEYKGFVYGFDGNIFSCVDAVTGKRAWKKGRYGNGQVLLLPDAGQLLIVSEAGELVLVKADPDKHLELGRIQALAGKTWNHPVLIGNRLYLRNAEEAACYELVLDPTAEQPASAVVGQDAQAPLQATPAGQE